MKYFHVIVRCSHTDGTNDTQYADIVFLLNHVKKMRFSDPKKTVFLLNPQSFDENVKRPYIVSHAKTR